MGELARDGVDACRETGGSRPEERVCGRAPGRARVAGGAALDRMTGAGGDPGLRASFLRKGWWMTLGVWAVLLLVVGLLVLVAEVFLPSGGILAVLTVGTLVASLTCAWLAWWPDRASQFWWFLGAVLGLIPLTVVGAFWIWPTTAIGRRALLEGPTAEEVDAFADETREFARFVGQVGTTATVLNPAGMLELGAERLHCQSEGALIAAGVRVVVVRATHNLVTVRPVPPGEDGGPTPRAGGVAPTGPGFEAGAGPVKSGTISEEPDGDSEVPPEFA